METIFQAPFDAILLGKKNKPRPVAYAVGNEYGYFLDGYVLNRSFKT